MKMKKKAGQESELSCRFFLIFPGCKSIRTAVFHTAQPVDRSVGQPIRKDTIDLLQTGFCVGGGAAAISQNNNCDFSKRFLRGADAANSQIRNLILQRGSA